MGPKLRHYERFLFVWLAITALYLAINFSLPFALNRPFGYITFFVGMFVPFGIWNVLASFGSVLKLILVVGLMVLSIFFADSIAIKLGIRSLVGRVIYNLVWLFILTLAVDMILWQQPLSIMNFVNGDLIVCKSGGCT